MGKKKEQDTRRESDKKTDFNATGDREGKERRRMKDESESDLQTAIDF